MDALDPEVARLVSELNGFGEDTEPQLIASMYRHLAYWPAYLALVRTMLAPLQADGRLDALTRATRTLGHAHGADAGAAVETIGAAGHAACRAEIVPPVRGASDRAHDRAVRADPPRDAGLNKSTEPSLRAKRSNPFFLRSGYMDCFASLAMTVDTVSRSRGALRPRFAGNSSPSPNRGRRECRMRAAPAVSCAMGRRSAHMSIQGSGEHPTFPAQWLYGL